MGDAILGIDPGHAGQGNACAAFVGGRLAATWFERVTTHAKAVPPPYAPSAAQYDAAGWFDVIVVEQPVYQGERSNRARPADLMNLSWSGALLAGAYAGRDGAPIVALPANDSGGVRGWKGSEPKPVMHARLWEVLDDEERAIMGGDRTWAAIAKAREKGALNRWGRPGASYYPRTWVRHNELDAVALVCVYLGRLVRRG